jgi:hypothetical protein
MQKRLFSLIILSTLALLVACSSGGGGESEDSGVEATSCGTIANGQYKNPVSDGDGEVVFLATVSEVNTLIVQNQFGEDLLVRLIGLSDEPKSKLSLAKSFISSFASGGMLFVSAGCNDLTIGSAIIGAMFNREGKNLSEELVKIGLAIPKDSDVCGGTQIAECLNTIYNTNPINAGELDRFLWKPVSDSDGKLAIHTGPFGTTVVVSGETGRNQGSGNGYGSLARFARTGCAYGGARIQVLNSEGIPYLVGGKTTFTIPNPCGRYCVEGGDGNVFACVKN